MELREQLALLGYVARITAALEVIAERLPPRGSLEFETPQGELGVATPTTSFDPALVQTSGPADLGESLGVVS